MIGEPSFNMPNENEAGTEAAQRTTATQQQNVANFFNPFAIELPEKLDFRDSTDWKRWISRWERYRLVSGLHLRDAETQVNTFLYAMGKGAEDILASVQLTDAELTDYAFVKGKFEQHFIPCTNIIFERAKFNRRKQEANESVEMFITELHKLAETRKYGPLKEELIHDRLVVGLLDLGLSEKLQLDSSLHSSPPQRKHGIPRLSSNSRKSSVTKQSRAPRSTSFDAKRDVRAVKKHCGKRASHQLDNRQGTTYASGAAAHNGTLRYSVQRRGNGAIIVERPGTMLLFVCLHVNSTPQRRKRQTQKKSFSGKSARQTIKSRGSSQQPWMDAPFISKSTKERM